MNVSEQRILMFPNRFAFQILSRLVCLDAGATVLKTTQDDDIEHNAITIDLFPTEILSS